MSRKIPVAVLRLGRILATPGVCESIPSPDVHIAISRHQAGDWGDLSEEDRMTNNVALENGGRILSAYLSSSGSKFWIITEADRSVTTILLPSEY